MEASGGAWPAPLLVLLNPYAGGVGLTAPDALARELEEEGVAGEVEVVDPAQLAERIEGEKGHRSLIGVAGGDGSHATAAGVLVGSRTALVPIPTGRLNHFARRAGIATVAEAAAAVGSGEETSIAVGRLDGRVFLDTAVVGSYGELVAMRERLRRWLTTWPAAAVSALLMLARWPRVRLAVRAPDLDLETRTAMLWVGVGRNSFPEPHRAPLAREVEGEGEGEGEALLQLVILRGGRRAAPALLASLLRYRWRGHHALAGDRLEVWHLPWLELRSPDPIPLVLDGERRMVEPPVRLALEPDGLRVVVRRPDGGSRRDR